MPTMPLMPVEQAEADTLNDEELVRRARERDEAAVRVITIEGFFGSRAAFCATMPKPRT